MKIKQSGGKFIDLVRITEMGQSDVRNKVGTMESLMRNKYFKISNIFYLHSTSFNKRMLHQAIMTSLRQSIMQLFTFRNLNKIILHQKISMMSHSQL